MIKKLDGLGYGCIAVTEDMTEYGAILTFDEAKICAELFKKHGEEISGIICCLPNFGEELGVAEAITLAGLNVPVLVQACNDDFNKLDMANRRDAFCGKLSLCNNLYQRGIPCTLTTYHTCDIASESFTRDLKKFAGVCRVVNGLKGSRIAMLGARPAAFNTVRFSEKVLQKHGISVQTADLSEIIFNAMSYSDKEKVKAKIKEIREFGSVPEFITDELLERQAKLGLALEAYVELLDCDASTVQCWDSLEQNYGCAPCLAMAMMGDKGKPSACESDVTGALSMLAAHLATGTAPALMDWNNNIREDHDACICLHCSNFPKSFFAADNIEIECLDVIGSTLGKQNCFGACKGQVASGPMTFMRYTTDDCKGALKMYVGEGEFEPGEIPTNGGVANCRVKNLQSLMKYICENGFEHHVCFVRGHVADILEESAKYMGVKCYRHF
ncbi:MAG: fucose isomerase [Oscillospiraceae bacterium]|nr:fucose isomerase [Oscillospiraceae bacterium]